MSKKYRLIKETIRLQVDLDISLKILTIDQVTQEYVAWLNDKSIMALTEQADVSHSIETTIDYVDSCFKNPLIYFFGIYFHEEHIGNIKLGPVNEKHSTADIAYVIGSRQYWGQGIASRVIHAIIAFGFAELDLHKISAGAYENNIGSIKALLKNQMAIEGKLLEEVLFENKRINSLRLGVLKTNFIPNFFS